MQTSRMIENDFYHSRLWSQLCLDFTQKGTEDVILNNDGVMLLKKRTKSLM